VLPESLVIHPLAIIDDGNGCFIGAEVRRQNDMDIVRASIEGIRNQFFNCLVGTRIQAFRKQLNDPVTYANFYVRFFFTDGVEIPLHSPELVGCASCLVNATEKASLLFRITGNHPQVEEVPRRSITIVSSKDYHICSVRKIAHLYSDSVPAKVNERFDRRAGWSASCTEGLHHS
jgi:hypothetical protein